MFEIKGTKTTPFHLSCGVVLYQDDQVLVLKKSDGSFTLPRETMYTNESIEEALKRGAQEELGLNITPLKFLGSLKTFFSRDGVNIEKTTIYFLCSVDNEVENKKELDELDDEILWVEKKEAKEMLNECQNQESVIIDLI